MRIADACNMGRINWLTGQGVLPSSLGEISVPVESSFRFFRQLSVCALSFRKKGVLGVCGVPILTDL